MWHLLDQRDCFRRGKTTNNHTVQNVYFYNEVRCISYLNSKDKGATMIWMNLGGHERVNDRDWEVLFD